jgi:16S rRNA (guanine527-N7)-methyltransferase
MDLLVQGTEELGIALSDAQLDCFDAYYRELVDWNSRFNLTSITDHNDVQIKHFLDSLTLLLTVNPSDLKLSKVIDVGTGAGFPGIPLRIVFPELKLYLLDSVAKKTGFLEHVLERLNMPDVTVLTGRAETLAHDVNMRETFDFVLARALARLPVLLEYTLPFCTVGGQVIAWKHGGIDQEIDDAATACRLLGGKLAPVCHINLNNLSDNRILVLVDKTYSTPSGYPRKAGFVRKNPIT